MKNQNKSPSLDIVSQKQFYKEIKSELPRISRFKSSLILVAMLTASITEVITIFITTILFSALLNHQSLKFIKWIIFDASMFLLGLLLTYSTNYLLTKECSILKTKLRHYIFESYSNESGQRKINEKPGVFKSITIDNVDKYVDEHIKKKYKVIVNTFKILFSGILIFYMSWIIGLIAIAFSFLIIISGTIIAKTANAQKKYVKDLNEFNNDISKNLNLHSVFYLNNSQNKVINDLDSKFSSIEKKYLKFYNKIILFQIPALLLNIVSQVGLIIISSVLVIKGFMPTQNLVAISFMCGLFSGTTFLTLQHIQLVIKSSKMYHDFKVVEDKETERKYLDDIESIALKDYNITFEDHQIFDEKINITFKQGKKYVIVGESGSGKSVMINSILGRQHNYEGIVKINNLDAKEVSIRSLTNSIGLLNAKPHIFTATFFENVTVFNENLTHKDVVEAMELIKFTDFELDEKIDMNSVSEGQKQKINLLRVIVNKPKWILSDEGFSNIDNLSREHIMNYFLNVYDGGFINITHHLSAKEEVIYDSKISL